MQQHNNSADNPANRCVAAPAVPKDFLLLSVALCAAIITSLSGCAAGALEDKAKDQTPEEALRVALAEADKLDPGWRMEDIEAKRAKIPDAENAALCALAACRLLPKGWPTLRSLDRLAGRELDRMARLKYRRTLDSPSSTAQLNAQQMAILQAELREAEAALIEARKLADLPRGRFPTAVPAKEPAPNAAPLNPNSIEVRKLCELLRFDILVRTQQGDLDKALASWSALRNAGRAVGDEPNSVAQTIRRACQSLSIEQLQRILAQGVPSSSALRRAQRLLEEEAEYPLMLTLARNERAYGDLVMQRIEEGRFPVEDIEKDEKHMRAIEDSRSSSGEEADKSKEKAPKWYAPERIKLSRAVRLRYMTEFVEICKKPDWEQAQALATLEKKAKGQPAQLPFIVRVFANMAKNCRVARAQLRCAAIALAVERYRQANRHWPKSLAELVPGQLNTVPMDPFDGRPLRYRVFPEGVLVYSIGPRRREYRGDFAHNANDLLPGQTAEFRLWNPDLRRQKASPQQPLDKLTEPEP